MKIDKRYTDGNDIGKQEENLRKKVIYLRVHLLTMCAGMILIIISFIFVQQRNYTCLKYLKHNL